VDLARKEFKVYKVSQAMLLLKVFKDHLVSKAYRVDKVFQDLVSKGQAEYKETLVSKVFKVSKELPVELLLRVSKECKVTKDYKDKMVKVLQGFRVIQVGREYKVGQEK
jgi:hypothetical protein|tara:strand:- start:161 stop:487 length:327 start_codon:yes stop_codon:yes gene_type:complete